VSAATAPQGKAGRLAAALAALLVVAGVVVALEIGWNRTASGAAVPAVGRETPVSAMNMPAMAANNSPAPASDPTDHDFMVMANRIDGPQFGCALHASYDGGRGWLPVHPITGLPQGVDRCYAPEVDFDGAGRLHYLFVGLHGAGNSPVGVFLTTSSDRARHFTPPRQILGAERYMVHMAIDRDDGARGRLHLVWLEAGSSPTTGGYGPPPNPMMSAFSDDGGKTFSRPVQVSDAGRGRVVAPAMALTSDHMVHVLYYDLGDDTRDYEGLEGPVWEGRWSLVLSSSADAGAHFGRGVVVDSDIVPPQRVMLIYTMPAAALAADADRVYVAWTDGRGGDWDALMRSSSDRGATWSAAQRLNDDPVRDGRHQYLPQLRVAPRGRLDALFYDRRNDALNQANDVYYTSSTDHGRTFSRNLRLTTLASDTRIGPHYAVTSARGLVEFGGRVALESDEDRVVAAWTDTRNEGRAPRAQDILSARLDLPATPPPWWRALGFAMAAAGLAGACIMATRRWARPRQAAPRGQP